MVDRSSRPIVIPGLTEQAIAERIVALRRQRLTGKHIASETGVSPATVSRVLKRAGLSRLRDIGPAEPIRASVALIDYIALQDVSIMPRRRLEGGIIDRKLADCHVTSSAILAELSPKVGDGGIRKAAYRGGA